MTQGYSWGASVFRSVWWSVDVHVHVHGLGQGHGRACIMAGWWNHEKTTAWGISFWGLSHSCLFYCVLFRLATAPPGTTPVSCVGRKGQEPLASLVLSLASAAGALPEGPPSVFLHVSAARPVAWPHDCQWRLGIHMLNSFSTLIGVESEEGGREWNLKYLAFMRVIMMQLRLFSNWVEYMKDQCVSNGCILKYYIFPMSEKSLLLKSCGKKQHIIVCCCFPWTIKWKFLKKKFFASWTISDGFQRHLCPVMGMGWGQVRSSRQVNCVLAPGFYTCVYLCDGRSLGERKCQHSQFILEKYTLVLALLSVICTSQYVYCHRWRN